MSSRAPAFAVADELAAELRVRDEVEPPRGELAPAPVASARRPLAPLPARSCARATPSCAGSPSGVDDPALREPPGARRAAARGALVGATGADRRALDLDVRLSPREIDVLACAALGATNAEIAATLGLREGTVKSYLQSAMAKLDAATRHAAVAKARRAGLLP